MTKSELFMGRNISGDKISVKKDYRITDGQIQQFLSDVVSPRFPGFTMLSGQGYWKGESEDCVVLVILHEWLDEGHADKFSIEAIIDEYKQKFHQESVLWVRSNVKSTF